MRNLSILLFCAVMAGAITSFAGAGYQSCSHSNSKHNSAKTTLADAGEGDYDIKYLNFKLNVTDTSTYIEGDVSTTAQVTASSMSDYIFELSTAMHIDSAKINGAILPVTDVSAIVRKITLPAALSSGAMFTAEIYYHGTPPTGAGFFNGVTHSVSAGGTHMMYTVSDPWVALNWWPTKQTVLDQADSVDMYVTVPYGVADGSNGLLINIDNTTLPGYSTYHWQTHYPIDYYLISIAVAKYGEYKSYMHFTGSPDSMLIQNFFLDTATFNPAYKANFDSLDQMINYFSTAFGVRYPFWKEKYGVCYTSLSGGMEHQTMTTIGVPNTTTIAHELTHQWFGDHVTYKTWGDMWLSEGFATYSEQLYLNQFWGAAAAKTHRLGYLSQTFSQPCGMTYVNDTTTSDSLFTTNQYPKAAMIISTLRYLAPTDADFFQVLKNYQTTYAYGNASTADFKAIAESVYGFSLDTFFNQWIYGRGFPLYKVSWNQIGSTVNVKLKQTTSCVATTHFSTPVELQLHSATADTIVKVYNSLDTQVFSFEWSPTMTNTYLNPDALTLCKQNGAIIHDATLGVSTILPRNIKVSPNPSRNFWRIEQLPEGTSLTLLDMNGNISWEGKSNKGATVIPGENLPAGNYLLKLNGENEDSIKLVHW